MPARGGLRTDGNCPATGAFPSCVRQLQNGRGRSSDLNPSNSAIAAKLGRKREIAFIKDPHAEPPLNDHPLYTFELTSSLCQLLEVVSG